MINPMRILVRLVLNRKFLEKISRCYATLPAIGCVCVCVCVYVYVYVYVCVCVCNESFMASTASKCVSDFALRGKEWDGSTE